MVVILSCLLETKTEVFVKLPQAEIECWAETTWIVPLILMSSRSDA